MTQLILKVKSIHLYEIEENKILLRNLPIEEKESVDLIEITFDSIRILYKEMFSTIEQLKYLLFDPCEYIHKDYRKQLVDFFNTEILPYVTLTQEEECKIKQYWELKLASSFNGKLFSM